MKRTALTLFAIALSFAVATDASARSAKIKNTSSSESTSSSSSSSSSNSNNSNNVSNNSNFKERYQAPGVGVSGSDCSGAFGISGPGAGIGFAYQYRSCKYGQLMDMADRYYGRPAARQVGCENVAEFRNLPYCVGARTGGTVAIGTAQRAVGYPPVRKVTTKRKGPPTIAEWRSRNK